MIEQKQHFDAFENYYKLGVDRTLSASARKTGITPTTAYRWAKLFKWKARVLKRDRDVHNKVLQNIDNDFINLRNKRLQEIVAMHDILGYTLKNAFEKIKNRSLQIETVSDLVRVVETKDRLTRLEMLLQSDKIVDSDLNITVGFED